MEPQPLYKSPVGLYTTFAVVLLVHVAGFAGVTSPLEETAARAAGIIEAQKMTTAASPIRKYFVIFTFITA